MFDDGYSASIVRIVNSKGDAKGAGFLISDTLIVTCFHVVCLAKGVSQNSKEFLNSEVFLEFPLVKPGSKLVAHVESCDEEKDIALLILKSPPQDARPVTLANSSLLREHKVQTFGFPKGYEVIGVHSSGKIIDNLASGWMQIEDENHTGYFVAPGFSGSPVWDTILGGVVGIIVAADKERGIAAAIPISMIIERWPELLDKVQIIDVLAEYREQLMKDTQLVDLGSIPLELKVPLDKVYIRLQAITIEQSHAQSRAETNWLEGQIREKMRCYYHQAAPEGFKETLCALGEYYYRQGKIFQETERPPSIDPQEALNQHEQLVVLGTPGSGKSTMLRYLARRAAGNSNGPIPILISLRDYANQLSNAGRTSIVDFFIQNLASNREALREALIYAIKVKHVLWLLDAFDEVHPDFRKKVASDVGHLSGKIILTSRPFRYVDFGQMRNWPHYEVQPLEASNINQFLHDWFSILAEKSGETKDWIEKQVSLLKGRLQDRTRLQPLMHSPLMLTFLVYLAGEDPGRELPHRRSDLYGQYIENLIERWELSRREQEDFCRRNLSHKEILQALNHMGWYLHQTYYGSQRDNRPDRKALIAVLEEFCVLKSGEKGVLDPSLKAETIMDFWLTARLLDLWKITGQEYVHFHLQTFQEYTVACWLDEKWQQDPDSAWNLMKSRLHHYAWREPILLLVEIWESRNQKPRVNELLIRLIKGPSPYERYLHRDLRLAATLLGEIESPDEQLTQEVIKRISNHIAFASGEYPLHERRCKAISWLSFILLAGNAIYISILIWPGTLMAKVILVVCMIVLVITSHIFVVFFANTHIPFIEKLCWLPQLLLNNVSLRQYPFIEALGDIGEPAISSLSHLVLFGINVKENDSRPAAVEALRRINRPHLTIPTLINTLGRISAMRDKTRYIYLCGFALSLITRFGQPAVVHLVEGFEKFGERSYFNLALGLIDDPEAEETLCIQLRHPDPIIRAAAAEALGRIGNPETASFLLDPLSNDTVDVRVAAAMALGRIGNLQAIPWLIEAMKNRDLAVHKAAISALGMVGKKTIEDFEIKEIHTKEVGCIIATLLIALNDPDPGIVVEAVYALGSMRAKEALPVLIKMLEDSRRSGANMLPLLHDLMINKNLLKDGDELSNRFKQNNIVFFKGLEVVRSLGEIRDPHAIDILIEVLEDVSLEALRTRDINQNPDIRGMLNRYFPPTPFHVSSKEILFIREAAAKALSRIGGPRVYDALVNALSDNSPEVSEAAIEALLDIADPMDQKIIIPLCQVKIRRNNIKLCRALQKIGKPAVTCLMDWLQDSSLSPSSRKGIIQMLGIIGDPSSVDFLIQILRQPGSKEEQDFAARALAKINTQRSIYALTETLGYNDAFLYLMAVETIGEHLNLIQSIKTARSIMRTLWCRKLNVYVGDPKNLEVGEREIGLISNWDAMEMVANRMSVLSVENERAEEDLFAIK